MKKRNLTLKISSVVIPLVLIAAMALCMTSCGIKENDTDKTSVSQTQTEVAKKKIVFSVTGADGKTENYNLETEKATLGEALAEAGIISEEESASGFVTTVNGVTLNWDTDKAYWALYVGENYAEKGVNETEITDGGEYSFVYTKG